MWLTLAGIAGYLLSWAGAELRGLCYQTLGKYFTFRLAVQEDQPLITSGPYAYLRHPGYLGAFLQGFGMELSLILANPISLCYGRNLFKYSKEVEIILLILGFFPGIVAMLRRMTEEEMMMKAKIGKEYTDWERRTWRLIPFIY
ncbi:hypothetical protein DACRYDRAFT_53287 [Dacryopinax primogenitus]|uniref:Protein-S-isoprenylcysteine O-methyltransferase n=1 Tax=Dacryopinax primogenitus (strain DJM 731) TaxID=1858805 RepID=M5FYN4_DACPD|nr:uncharacterized protein DACRYDRAFT_53287 [Dacryopinax primogenitus]EJU01000.1 hypothetical protein DACRYDRAFT_53287 [Dacryopinax primogenitus]